VFEGDTSRWMWAPRQPEECALATLRSREGGTAGLLRGRGVSGGTEWVRPGPCGGRRAPEKSPHIYGPQAKAWGTHLCHIFTLDTRQYKTRTAVHGQATAVGSSPQPLVCSRHRLAAAFHSLQPLPRFRSLLGRLGHGNSQRSGENSAERGVANRLISPAVGSASPTVGISPAIGGPSPGVGGILPAEIRARARGHTHTEACQFLVMPL